jgi:phage replication-related protein YjqB (UPF0714/DUF867 family)
MAFHGGLEAGTAEIARQAAMASGASLYCVEQPAALRWHVPSSEVDPDESPLLAQWCAHVKVAISVHGYGRFGMGRHILLGGRNRQLARRVGHHLGGLLSGFEIVTDTDAIPAELRGMHRLNPINRVRGEGVQLELPPAARGTTPAPPDPAWGEGGAPARIVDALVAAVAEYEAEAL